MKAFPTPARSYSLTQEGDGWCSPQTLAAGSRAGRRPLSFVPIASPPPAHVDRLKGWRLRRTRWVSCACCEDDQAVGRERGRRRRILTVSAQREPGVLAVLGLGGRG